ncbi:MAG: gamma-glutamylcyclotransferase family protein [Woeseiaceae bacterium]|nr:gamma-glutamylcyclotransferase family protein [Woeseiaceae bacterium]
MSPLRYAAYGSNLHPRRLEARVPSAQLLGTARLPGFVLGFNKRGMDGSAKCGIVAGRDEVRVAVYSLAPGDRAGLDRLEHAGTGYEVIDVDVPGYGTCFTYRVADAWFVSGLAPFCWYHEMVLKGMRLHGFPADYVAAIESVVPVRDPDAARRTENQRLLQTMEAAA